MTGTAGASARVGLRVVQRRYVSYDHAHYAGNLVDGAYGLALFGDAATELCILTDGDEGLFASYDTVQFLAPVHAGDVVEVAAVLVGAGRRSRRIEFTLSVMARGAPSQGRPGGAATLEPAILATTAVGTVVIPGPLQSDTPV